MAFFSPADAEREVEYADGEVVFREGDRSREMYIVLSGLVRVFKEGAEAREVMLAELGRGDFFGEMSLLESLPRSATVRAVGPTRLLELAPGGFLLRIRRDPTFAFEMLQQLSRRIRETSGRLIAATERERLSAEAVRRIVGAAEFGPGGSP